MSVLIPTLTWMDSDLAQPPATTNRFADRDCLPLLDKVGQHPVDTAELFFDDMRLPTHQLLGSETGRSVVKLMAQLPRERLIIGVGGVAAMQRGRRHPGLGAAAG